MKLGDFPSQTVEMGKSTIFYDFLWPSSIAHGKMKPVKGTLGAALQWSGKSLLAATRPAREELAKPIGTDWLNPTPLRSNIGISNDMISM